MRPSLQNLFDGPDRDAKARRLALLVHDRLPTLADVDDRVDLRELADEVEAEFVGAAPPHHNGDS
jgi:hypothetical protein